MTKALAAAYSLFQTWLSALDSLRGTKTKAKKQALNEQVGEGGGSSSWVGLRGKWQEKKNEREAVNPRAGVRAHSPSP